MCIESTAGSLVSCPLIHSGQDHIIWRLFVIVWRPLEHISAPSSETVGDREKVFRGNMLGATRVTKRLPSHGAVVNDKACRSASVYLHDRPTAFALT